MSNSVYVKSKKLKLPIIVTVTFNYSRKSQQLLFTLTQQAKETYRDE